jgi:hypothetical protein
MKKMFVLSTISVLCYSFEYSQYIGIAMIVNIQYHYYKFPHNPGVDDITTLLFGVITKNA